MEYSGVDKELPMAGGENDQKPEHQRPEHQKPDEEREGELALHERPKTRRPRLYRVLLHNDDYTTMEFVVWVLIEHFNKTRTEATQIMLHVHTKGVGTCGVYSYDMAETKVARVMEVAKEHGHPLKCTMEPE